MSKSKYWISASLLTLSVIFLFATCLPGLSQMCGISSERMLAYVFMLVGISVFYFGLLRPHWFAKQIIPTHNPIKFKVSKKTSFKVSLKDDSYFWNLFPYALFFTFGGVAYLLYPSPYSLLVAFVCSAWVRILYKYV
ncbi:hypothetical protein [Bdellovibrio sp. HCB337]|uniref:hypothetical protein n=1 Tax=Bdellovibrio sp. HCB337 TaxID=3394358 RepID=UPI0039A5EC99